MSDDTEIAFTLKELKSLLEIIEAAKEPVVTFHRDHWKMLASAYDKRGLALERIEQVLQERVHLL